MFDYADKIILTYWPVYLLPVGWRITMYSRKRLRQLSRCSQPFGFSHLTSAEHARLHQLICETLPYRPIEQRRPQPFAKLQQGCTNSTKTTKDFCAITSHDVKPVFRMRPLAGQFLVAVLPPAGRRTTVRIAPRPRNLNRHIARFLPGT